MNRLDLIAGLVTLAALITIGAIYALTGNEIVSTDLQAALSAFLVAALTRWRLSRPDKPQEKPEPIPDPVAPDETSPLSVDTPNAEDTP